MPRPPKIPDVLDEVRKAADTGSYRISKHAEERMIERQVNLAEVDYILRNGYHEARKDEFDENRQKWRYAIRGRTVDRRDIRLAVSFDGRMWIVTVIDKDRQNEW